MKSRLKGGKWGVRTYVLCCTSCPNFMESDSKINTDHVCLSKPDFCVETDQRRRGQEYLRLSPRSVCFPWNFHTMYMRYVRRSLFSYSLGIFFFHSVILSRRFLIKTKRSESTITDNSRSEKKRRKGGLSPYTSYIHRVKVSI